MGFRLNVYLLLLSLAILAFVWTIRLYFPQTSIAEQWRTVLVSLIGFLTMVLSGAIAFRNLSGAKCGIVLALSFLIGIVHLLDMIVSMPFS